MRMVFALFHVINIQSRSTLLPDHLLLPCDVFPCILQSIGPSWVFCLSI